MKQTRHLETAMDQVSVAIVLTDPRLEDNPITFVNSAFERLTQYSREYAVGRNCRFLQGAETEDSAVEDIRDGLRRREDFQVVITNHKADGTAFKNLLLISPVWNDEGELFGFFGVQRELAGPDLEVPDAGSLNLLRELQHRVKNHLSMVVSMIRLQAARPVSKDSFASVGRRIESLALLYEEMFDATVRGGAGNSIHTGAYLSRIASVVANIGGDSAIRVNVDCDEIDLPVDQAARLGLLLSELLTNAFQHAFEGRDRGLISVRFKKLSNGVRLIVEDDGIGLPEDSNWPHGARTVADQTRRARTETGELDTTGGDDGGSGVGGTIVAALTQDLGATLSVSRPSQGTLVSVDFELSN